MIQGQTVDKDSLQDAILSAEDMLKAGKKMNSWVCNEAEETTTKHLNSLLMIHTIH